MFYIPACAVAACRWMTAQAALRAELGREPAENEVLVRLGWPIVLSRTEFPLEAVTILAGTTVALPGTRLRLRVERPFNEGPVKLTLLETPA